MFTLSENRIHKAISLSSDSGTEKYHSAFVQHLVGSKRVYRLYQFPSRWMVSLNARYLREIQSIGLSLRCLS